MTNEELELLKNPPCIIQLREKDGNRPLPLQVNYTRLEPNAVLMYEFDGQEWHYEGCFFLDEIESVMEINGE
jgi:hypothetical protein